MRIYPTIDAPTRFWKRVKKTKSCWIWDGNGRYGKIQVGNREFRKHISAHRFSWEIHNGKIPEGMWVLHKCDFGRCVKPNHLFLGTYRDNIDDMLDKRRNVIGEKVGNSKLKESMVREIRKLYALKSGYHDSQHGYYGLAKRFKMSPSMIRYIVKNTWWKHIGGS